MASPRAQLSCPVLILMDTFFDNPDGVWQTNTFVSFAQIHPISSLVEQETIRLRKALRIKLPDAIIAATALVHDQVLITGNSKDFRHVSGLRFENPIDW